MSGLDFDDIHGDIAPALAEMSRLLRIVPLSPPDPAERGGLAPSRFESVEHAGSGDHAEVTA